MDTISIISTCVLALSVLIVDDYAKLKSWPMTLWRGLMVISVISLLIHPLPVTIVKCDEILGRVTTFLFAASAVIAFWAVFHIIAWILAIKPESITDFLAGKKED